MNTKLYLQGISLLSFVAAVALTIVNHGAAGAFFGGLMAIIVFGIAMDYKG